MTGKKIALEFSEDSAAISGVRVSAGDFVMDGTVRGRLNRLRTGLKQL